MGNAEKDQMMAGERELRNRRKRGVLGVDQVE